ncbi:unnamed protein product [Amoebophrya sp. A25]|nr:unnamed protein product [Amoebophrya sp. A25]|eukprot:GSA25T00008863001.1
MSLLETLDQETLKKILSNAIQAGVVDKETLNPVHQQSYEHVVSGNLFEVPPECDRVQYLSEGGYGVVTKCRCLNPAKYNGFDQVAVKKVSLPHERAFDGEWEDNIRLLREIHFMKHLPHPNVTPIISLYMNKEARGGDLKQLKCFYIVMPLYVPGSIDQMGVIDDQKVFCGIMRDCVSGLLWMHKHKVLHRDIKRENIFYDEINKNAVIADLGMARSTKKKMTGGRECSTKSYLAPELIMETTESYSFPVDIWALGCVFYEMLIFADEGGSMFAESNPYHLILARQYSINKTFGTKLSRKRIMLGTHHIQQIATQEGSWVRKRWLSLEKQLDKFTGENGWEESMKPFLEDTIKKCLQFYPEERCSAQELADMLKKSFVAKLVGGIHMPKRVKQSTVTENFFEEISKLKSDKDRGQRIREHLYELTKEEDDSSKNPFVNVPSYTFGDSSSQVDTSPRRSVLDDVAPMDVCEPTTFQLVGKGVAGNVLSSSSVNIGNGGSLNAGVRHDSATRKPSSAAALKMRAGNALGMQLQKATASTETTASQDYEAWKEVETDRPLLVFKPASSSKKYATDEAGTIEGFSGADPEKLQLNLGAPSVAAKADAKTPKASPRGKARAKVTPAAKRRNWRKAMAMPTIDEDDEPDNNGVNRSVSIAEDQDQPPSGKGVSSGGKLGMSASSSSSGPLRRPSVEEETPTVTGLAGMFGSKLNVRTPVTGMNANKRGASSGTFNSGTFSAGIASASSSASSSDVPPTAAKGKSPKVSAPKKNPSQKRKRGSIKEVNKGASSKGNNSSPNSDEPPEQVTNDHPNKKRRT